MVLFHALFEDLKIIESSLMDILLHLLFFQPV
jgi:hypothetical protein